MKTFLAMGGYAAYVWTAYALVLIILVAQWLGSKRRLKKILQTIRSQRAL